MKQEESKRSRRPRNVAIVVTSALLALCLIVVAAGAVFTWNLNRVDDSSSNNPPPAEFVGKLCMAHSALSRQMPPRIPGASAPGLLNSKNRP